MSSNGEVNLASAPFFTSCSVNWMRQRQRRKAHTGDTGGTYSSEVQQFSLNSEGLDFL